MGCRDEAVLQRYWKAMERPNGHACTCKVVIEVGRPFNGLGIQNFSDTIGLEDIS